MSYADSFYKPKIINKIRGDEMAKVFGPLLSLSASGQIAKTMVATRWKGIKVMRQFVIPANPQTAAQTAQRDRMAVCVNAWRQFITPAIIRTAWDVMAGLQSKPQSGFNWFTSNCIRNIVTDPNASYASFVAAAAGEVINITMLNVDDGATGDEAGNFTVFAGDKSTDLSFFADIAITAGTIVVTDTGQAGNIRFYSVQKDGFERQGISKLTVVA